MKICFKHFVYFFVVPKASQRCNENCLNDSVSSANGADVHGASNGPSGSHVVLLGAIRRIVDRFIHSGVINLFVDLHELRRNEIIMSPVGANFTGEWYPRCTLRMDSVRNRVATMKVRAERLEGLRTEALVLRQADRVVEGPGILPGDAVQLILAEAAMGQLGGARIRIQVFAVARFVGSERRRTLFAVRRNRHREFLDGTPMLPAHRLVRFFRRNVG